MKVNIVKPMKPVIELPIFIVIKPNEGEWFDCDDINNNVEILTGYNPGTESSWRYVIINTYNETVDYHDRFPDSLKPVIHLTEQEFFIKYNNVWREAIKELDLEYGDVFG